MWGSTRTKPMLLYYHTRVQNTAALPTAALRLPLRLLYYQPFGRCCFTTTVMSRRQLYHHPLAKWGITTTSKQQVHQIFYTCVEFLCWIWMVLFSSTWGFFAMFLDKIVWDCCLWSTYCVRACTNELAENFDRATFMMVAIYTGVGNDEGKDTVGQWQVAGGLTGLGLYFDIAEGLNQLFPLYT